MTETILAIVGCGERVEQVLGRPLLPTEQVHHKNHNRLASAHHLRARIARQGGAT